MARGDILLVTLPESDKREEKGTRPVIAVQADDEQSPMLMVIPLTSLLNLLDAMEIIQAINGNCFCKTMT
jgi:mRNA interferase MazF